MTEIRDDRRYNPTHEWARCEDSALVSVGLSDFAIEALNREIVFIELPPPGTPVTAGEPFGVIEAVKAAYDLFAPVSGVVARVHAELSANPALAAQAPYDEGWMIQITAADAAEWERLLTAQAYRELVEREPQ